MVAQVHLPLLPQAPKSLSSFANGLVPYGLYSGPVANVGTAPWAAKRRSQRKAWMYTGAFTERYYVGLAIADAGLVATAFAYVFDAQTNKYVEEKITVPFGFAANFDAGMDSAWKLKQFEFKPNGNTLLYTYSGKRLKVSLELEENGQGSSTIAPAPGRPFHFTYKNLQLPTKVNIEVDGEKISLEGNIGGVDFSKGYPPRHTNWNWASLNATAANGSPLGINLVANFNNNIENALWYNGQIIQLGQAVFSYGQPLEKTNWTIKTLDGIIEMTFTPLGYRGENINALIMLSKFKQPFGVFKGTLNLNGESHAFTGYGVVEEHFAIW